MTAHLSNEIVERFHTQALAGGDRALIYDHILGCESCRLRIVDARSQSVALRALSEHLLPRENEEPYHLDYETIEAFVDEKLDTRDRSTARLHLEDCPECSGEVADLRESLATMRAASRQPEERPPSIEITSRRSSRFSMPMRIAAIAALVAFAVVGLLVASRWRSTGPSPAQGNGRGTTAGSQPTPLASPQTPSLAPSPNIVNQPKLVENAPPKTPERKGAVLVALKDGASEIALDQAGNVVGLPSLSAESRQAVKDALTGEPLKRPDVLDEIASADVSVRAPTGNEERVSITYPADRVIQENQPSLRWTPSKTAEAFRIEIADETFHQIAKSEDLPNTSQSWRPSTPLKRGRIYTWTIRVVKHGGTPATSTSQAKFKVLSEDKAGELNQLKSGSRSHLALGLFYAREGMTAEAEREFGILVKDNPDSTVARRLLKNVRSWQRR